MACVMGCFCAYSTVWASLITKLERAQVHCKSFPLSYHTNQYNFYLHSLCTNQRQPFLPTAGINSPFLPLPTAQSSMKAFAFPASINTSLSLPFLLSSPTTIPLTDLRQRYGSSSMAAPSSSLGRRSVINDLAFWGKDGKLMLQYSPIPRPISYCSSVPFPD